MMKDRFTKCQLSNLVFLLASIITALLFLNTACSDDFEETFTKDYILIYNGRSADRDSVRAIARAVGQLGRDVEYISELSDLPDKLRYAEAFVIGGTTYDTGYILEPLMLVREALDDYIYAGGRYLGICGGAYIASTGSEWEDGYEVGIGIIDVESFEYESEINNPQIISVSWLGADRSIYYLNGPGFYEHSLSNANIYAYYEPGVVAALITEYGSGKIALSGPHPEADITWLIDDPEPLDADKWSTTWDLFLQLFEELLADD